MGIRAAGWCRPGWRIAFLLWFVLAGTPPAIQAAEDPLRMGVFPRRNFTETAMGFAPTAEYLGAHLKRKVEVITSRNFESFWKAVMEKRYDIVHYNQYHYIRSAQDYQVIAHIEELGRNTIAGVVYVTRDSGITTLAQLRGRTVIFGGGEDAMISYIANRYLLLQAGLKKNDFKSVFAVNPPNAILALSRRQAAAAGAGDGVLELPAVKDAVDPGGLTALATSAPLLQLPVAVRRDMPARLRAAIQAILVDMKNSEAGRQALQSAFMTGMGRAEDADYDPHRRMAAAVFGQDGDARRLDRVNPPKEHRE